jgi:hypothetical protein
MTTSGKPVQLTGLDPIELVPADEAQQYIHSLKDELSAVDGEPLFLVHDGATSTSHDFIVEAEQHVHLEGSLNGSRLLKLMTLLVKARHTFRIWWASNKPGLTIAIQCNNIDQLIATIEKQVRDNKDLSIRYMYVKS